MITDIQFIINSSVHSGSMIKLDKKKNVATVRSYINGKKYKVNWDLVTVSNKYRLKPPK